MDLWAIALQIGFGVITCDFILALLFSALTVSRCLKNLKAFGRHNELFVLHILNFVIKKKKALFFISGCERIHSAAKLFFQVFDLGR